jgi:hypothetical protein
MAFATPTAVKVNTLTVGTQVVLAAAADGHCYVQATPASGSGLTYPTVVSIQQAVNAPGAGATDGLWTVYLSGNAFSKPIDFTLNANTDWVVTTTGTA